MGLTLSTVCSGNIMALKRSNFMAAKQFSASMLVYIFHVSSYARGGCTVNANGVSEVTKRRAYFPLSAPAERVGYMDVGGL